MLKKFDEWNELKKNLHKYSMPPYFKPREIWWCNLGCNIGFEQDGKGRNFSRPVLVLNSYNRNIFLSVPLSSKIKQDNFYYKRVKYNNEVYSVIISQIRLLDSKRLIRKITTLDKKQYDEVRNYVKAII
jgi:mRNA interferase MazF